MAISPVNYGIDLAPLNPAQQIMQGMSVGQGLLDAREQGLQRQQAAQMRPMEMQAAQLGLRNGLAAEADANVARSMQQAMAQSAAIAAAQKQEAKQRLATSKMGPEDFARFGVMYPDEAAKMKDVVGNLSAEQKRQFDSDAGQVFAGLDKGNKEEVQTYLNQRIEATKAAGMDATALENLSKSIDTNETAARNMTGGYLSVSNKDFAKSLTETNTMGATVKEAGAKADIAQVNADNRNREIASALKLETAQAAKYYSDIKNDAKRLDLDERKFADESAARLKEFEFKANELPTNLVPTVLKMSDESVAADLVADDWDKVSSEFAKYDTSIPGVPFQGDKSVATGLRGSFNETVKSALGVEDGISVLRKRYKGMVAKGVVDNLPQGAASDTDIALVKDGFPEGTTDPKILSDFAKAAANVSRADAKVKAARAEFLSRNKGTGLARGDFMVAGVPVKAGDTEADVMRRVFAVSKLER